MSSEYWVKQINAVDLNMKSLGERRGNILSNKYLIASARCKAFQVKRIHSEPVVMICAQKNQKNLNFKYPSIETYLSEVYMKKNKVKNIETGPLYLRQTISGSWAHFEGQNVWWIRN